MASASVLASAQGVCGRPGRSSDGGVVDCGSGFGVMWGGSGSESAAQGGTTFFAICTYSRCGYCAVIIIIFRSGSSQLPSPFAKFTLHLSS